MAKYPLINQSVKEDFSMVQGRKFIIAVKDSQG